jgi:hypothetical protein
MKITPEELSREPIRVEVACGEYDFSTQKRIGAPSELARKTQTYNNQGKPVDSDV